MRFAWLLAVAPLTACGPDGDSGACRDNLLAGELVITEVFADFAAPTGGTGTDDGKEWFEVYNNADRPVSLRGVTVVHSRPDGSRSASHTIDDVTVAPGQFFTLGNATDDLIPPYVDYGFSADLGDFFNTDGGKLALKCGDAVIDEAIYDAVRSGHARQLTNLSPPDYTLNDDQNNWCEANDTEFEANNFGTPGQDNDCAPVVAGACTDAGSMRPVVSPGPGELVITEIMPQPAGDDGDQEWFEAKALADFDLNGISIDRVGDTSGPTDVASATCIPVVSGSYVIFGKSMDMALNGGLPPGSVVSTFGASLVNGSTTTPGDISLLVGTTTIDAVTWTRSAASRSLQLDPDLENATANDDVTSFCDATGSYGAGGEGTPGAINGQCTMLPPAGMCDDNGTNRAIVPPPANALVITEIMPNPVTEPSQEWFEITNVGSTPFDLNGLGLDRDDDTAAPNVVTSALCKSLAPGGFALFARSADPATNGGLPTPDATYSFSLIQSNGTISVVDPASCTGSVCTVTHDRTIWGSTTTTGLPDRSVQLQPAMFTTTANDDFGNYCFAPLTQTYGTSANHGTPKAANACN